MTRRKDKSISLRRHLIRSASGSLILRLSNTALALLVAVVLARTLGVEHFGIYTFCISIVQILTVPAMLGGQQLLVREVAAYQTKGQFKLLRGLLTRFRQASVLASLVLSLAASLVALWIYRDSPLLVPFLLAMALVPLQTAMQLQGAALRGLRHILLGQTAQTLRPALVIAFVGVLFWNIGRNLRAEDALYAQLAACALLVALTFLVLRRLLPSEAKNIPPDFETSKWAKSILPFVFAGAMQILNRETSLVLLGILQGPEEVGLFRVAQRGAMLIPFGLQAVNMAIAPTVSQLFTKGEKERLQRLLSKSILAVLAFAIPVTLFLILGGKWILPFVFGREFLTSYMPLVILCLGQMINAAMGPVGLILNMAGLERFTARGVAIAAAVSVLLNIALIPVYGPIGAAVATSTSLIVWNVLLCIWLYRKTGIVSTIRWGKV